MGRWVAAPALWRAACLAAPPSALAPGADDGGGGDAGGLVDPGQVRFRSIGPTGEPLAEVVVTLSEDGLVVTIPVDLAAQLVVGVAVEIGDDRSHVLAIAGGDLLLEEPLLAEGDAQVWHAYPSLAEWHEERGRDLVADGVSEVAVIAADQQLLSQFDIDDFATDADHRVIIRGAEGRAHTGQAGTGVTVRSDGSGCIRTQTNHVTIEQLEFEGCGSMANHASIKSLSAIDVVVDRVLIHDYTSEEPVSALASVDGGELTVRNTIVHEGVIGVDVDQGSSVVVENCTFWNLDGPAVRVASGGAGSVRNTIMIETDGTFDAPAQDHNVTDFALAGAISSDAASLFVSTSESAPDLHLAAGATDALGGGADLRSSFEHDVDGEPRGDVWDIGADQLTPATPN